VQAWNTSSKLGPHGHLGSNPSPGVYIMGLGFNLCTNEAFKTLDKMDIYFCSYYIGTWRIGRTSYFFIIETKVPDSVLVIIYPVLILTITYLGIIIYGYLYKKYR